MSMSLAEVQVDEDRLDRDGHYRLTHYQEFLGWTEADHEAVRATTAKVVPYAQQLIDAVYDHLFRFSSTARYFLDENGLIRDAFLRKRKETLGHWIATVAGGPSDEFQAYLERVGRMHTAHAGEVRERIPGHYMVLLLGVVQAQLTSILADEIADRTEMAEAVTAWNKLLILSLEGMLGGWREG
jgi:hypothetical protein